jgi:crotonobetainyl-CoA:carnitine CoA-transferase CaiB-like acyl-CoA transferase
VVSGVHALSAQLALVTQTGIDQKVFRTGRSGRTQPNWRIYECADGRWFFLASLTPELFFRTLTVLDRLEILLLPSVDGEFTNINDEDGGGRVASNALEDVFRQQPRQYWLDLLQAADVPCAGAQTRAEWLASDVVADNQSLITRRHPSLGYVTMVNFPARLERTPARPGRPGRVEGDPVAWSNTLRSIAASGPGRAAELPLVGLRVVDASSFQAAPFAAELLASWGADVVKVEPPPATRSAHTRCRC